MYDLFRRIRVNFLLTSVLSCILGLLLITSPGAAMRTVFLLVGWTLVISGVASLLTAIFSKGQPVGQGELVRGLVQLASDVGGRHDDGEGLLLGVALGLEAAGILPLLIDPGFHLPWLVDLGQFFVHVDPPIV